MKHDQLDSILAEDENVELSTKGSENQRKMLDKKKISTSSLPESRATSRIYELKPKVYEEKLFSFFEHSPNQNKNGYQTCSQKWNQLGKIPISQWVSSGKIEIDVSLRVQELTNEYGCDKYFGQINSQGQYHGLGRHCMVTGQIYEGMFFDGLRHGYGREVDYHHNYTGMWDRTKKLDENSIEWSSGQEDSILSTRFDQTLLRAKMEMTGALKDNIMNKIKQAQKRSAKGQKEESKKESPAMSKEEALAQVVDQLWNTYDDDGNGYLDQDETRNFIKETLGQVSDSEFSEEAFQELFIEFDEDKSGTIEKDELVKFMQKLIGF